MSGCGSSGSGLSVTLTARMRANPHTTTGHQANPLPRTHSHRHRASPSSHNDTRGPPNRPAPATQTAIVRVIPHTMTPHPVTPTASQPPRPPLCEPIPICGLHGQPVMAQNHRSRTPAHAIPDRSWLSQPDQPRKSSGAHIGTYATQQINPKQIHLHSQPSRHACRDIHNPANRVSTVPRQRSHSARLCPTDQSPRRHTSHLVCRRIHHRSEVLSQKLVHGVPFPAGC